MSRIALHRMRRARARLARDEADLVGSQPTKQCRACCSPMPVAANKCVKCGGLQDWQRFVTSTASLLGVAVASASVLAFAIPIWRAQFYVAKPRPYVTIANVSNGVVVLNVSNAGDAPMSIGDAWVRFGSRIALLSNPTNPGMIVKPNSIEPIKFVPAKREDVVSLYDFMVEQGIAGVRCYIRVDVHDNLGDAMISPEASLEKGYDCSRIIWSLRQLP